MMTTALVTWKIYNLNKSCMNSGMVMTESHFLRERPSHILYLWHLAYKYNILNAMRQQLRNEFTADGSSTPDVGSVQKQKSPPSSNDPSVITNGLSNNIQQIAASINGLVGVS